jgi:uncharacterized DUF497 family protein
MTEGGNMYTWDEAKNQKNKQKHGFYLEEVIPVFADTHSIEFYDAAHSTFEEDRYILIGRLNDKTILYVVTTDKRTGDTQVITARKAEPLEKELYDEHYRRETGGN